MSEIKDIEEICNKVIEILQKDFPVELKTIESKKQGFDMSKFGHTLTLDPILNDNYFFGNIEDINNYPAIIVNGTDIDYPGRQYGANNKYEEHTINIQCHVIDDLNEKTSRKIMRYGKCLINVIIRNHILEGLVKGGYTRSLRFIPAENANGNLVQVIDIEMVYNMISSTNLI
jgi:hypothetical protein